MSFALFSTLTFALAIGVFSVSFYWRGHEIEAGMLFSSLILGACVVPTLIRLPKLREHFCVDPVALRDSPCLALEKRAAMVFLILLAFAILAGLYHLLKIQQSFFYALISSMVTAWLGANLMFRR